MAADEPPQGGMPGMAGPWGNLLNDPAIMELAEKLQQDPSFQQMQEALQQTFAEAAAAQGGAGGEAQATEGQDEKTGENSTEGPQGSGPGPGPGPGPQFPGLSMFPGMDSSNAGSAMSAMQQLYSNPAFMEMAQKIGENMFQQNPVMKAMMDPSRREAMQAKFEELKKDPEIAPIMAEMESGSPQAMMKYWNNPDVLMKFSEAVEEVMNEDVEGGAAQGEAEVEGPPSMQQHAGEGNLEGLKSLVEQGVDIDDADEEGRTALHFACGYGEMECVKWLLEKGAKLDSSDSNNNTALHYAAGYGQVDVVDLLLHKGADITSRNEDGNTSREVAELNAKDDIVKLLEGAMKELKI